MKIIGNIVASMALFAISANAQQSKTATNHTIERNNTWYGKLDFKDSSDWKDANRGFIATVDSGIIHNSKGGVLLNTSVNGFLKGDAPATVNPALWRHAKIEAVNGLFKVTDDVYQVRGLDLANITFVKTKSGYVVVDPLTNADAAKAALRLVQKHVADLPVVAVITSHSHADHFGGIAGVASRSDIISGKIPYIAPKDFYKESVSENVLLGNAMKRRAVYQFGSSLPYGADGAVDQGIGKSYDRKLARIDLWPSTVSIDSTGTKKEIDGVEFVFQYTPNTEAPAEMTFYLPRQKVYFSGELATRTLHNLLPARGTKVRDSKAWALDLDAAIDLFGKDVEYLVPAHTWPVFGHDNSISYLQKQRDLYLFIHNQTIHLANQGLNADEIAERLELPESLSKEWYTQDFYGTVKHNSKAVYQYYLGWYDGNPANYDRLPQEEEARRYVSWFGGEDSALKKAKEDYAKGDYRWVVQVLKWVVFNNPENKEAKYLQADAFEQLGYQSESAVWRNLYLVAAKELRQGTPSGQNSAASSFLRGLDAEGLFDFLSIAVDGNQLENETAAARFKFTDTKKDVLVFAQNGVLHQKGYTGQQPVDFTIEIAQQSFIDLLLNPSDALQMLQSKDVRIEGNPLVLRRLFGSAKKFDPFWNIVTP